MTNEQTKTQELLAILQTRPWTKAERALARQHIHRYYERKLAGLQRALFEAIGLNASEKLTPFEVDEYIHRYHKQSQELYVYMNYRSSSNESLPGWLRAIDADDQGIAVWQPATRLPHEEEPQDQETTYREEKERVSCISSRCRTRRGSRRLKNDIAIAPDKSTPGLALKGEIEYTLTRKEPHESLPSEVREHFCQKAQIPCDNFCQLCV